MKNLRLTGTSALAISTVGTNLVRIVSTIVLTRLLAPDVYGITGLIMSVFYTINMITDIGLQSYIVRHERSDEPDFLSSVFTLHAIRGVGLAVIGVGLAWPLSGLLGKSELAAPLAVTSLVFLIDGHVSLRQFAALRRGAVQRFAMISFFSSVSQTLSAIAFAIVMRNVWAIISSLFIASAVRVWASYALFPGSQHRYRIERNVARDLWRFSRVVGTSSALTLVITQIDKLALGRILTLSEFGTFIIAASLANAPTVFASNYASTIVYPAVAAAWREGRSIRKAYYGCWGRFFYLYLFGGGALIGCADLIVRLLYDTRYLDAGHYLAILSISTAFGILTRSMESMQVASGRQRVAVEFNSLRLIWLCASVVLAIFRGEPMLIVFGIGLLEIPVYGFGLIKLSRLHQIRWTRDGAVPLVLLTGYAIGALTSVAARALIPSI